MSDAKGNVNHWWLWTRLEKPRGAQAWISAYYLTNYEDDAANQENGVPIPDC